jgi:aromatic-L-amino-acid decarboxylase
VLYTSDQVHSSVVRAAHVAGLAAEHVRLLPADDGFRLPLDALATAVAADRAAGLVPFLVVANAGATNTGAVDPLAALSGFCREQDLWLHVDAAYGGFAVLTGRGRERLQGIQLADSITLDPHKWLFQTYEAGCLLLRHGTLLDASFHIMPDYLRDAAVAGKEVNFADRGFQLTRMARALKIWLSLHSFGVPAFRQAVDIALDLADEAEQRIANAAQLELLAPAGFGIVCFRRHPPGQDDEDTLERLNTRILQQLNASGLAMISSTRLRGRYALRLCIMNWRTRARDVARILDAIEDAPSRE